MGLNFDYHDGQTPLSEEEKDGLLISSITTHAELNEHEQLNIQKAVEWSILRKHKQDKIFTEAFVKKLHRKMFSNVWAWAGSFRKTEKNIGVSWVRIGVELRCLLEDAQYWVEHGVYEPDEMAIRFKHRLVSIHCFSNGNGRHSRLMADIIVESIFGKDAFLWHRSDMVAPNDVRKAYIAALVAGDKGDLAPLLAFARYHLDE